MAEDMAAQVASRGVRQNPLDKPYEQAPTLTKAPDFFQESPFVALGMRWSRQNRAIQRKWFIDEITDNYPATIGKTTDNLYVPEKGIGKWVTQDESGKYLERVRTTDAGEGFEATSSLAYNQYTTQALRENIDDFRVVKGIAIL